MSDILDDPASIPLFEEDPQALLAMAPSMPMHAYMMHGSDPQTYAEENGHIEWEVVSKILHGCQEPLQLRGLWPRLRQSFLGHAQLWQPHYFSRGRRGLDRADRKEAPGPESLPCPMLHLSVAGRRPPRLRVLWRVPALGTESQTGDLGVQARPQNPAARGLQHRIGCHHDRCTPGLFPGSPGRMTTIYSAGVMARNTKKKGTLFANRPPDTPTKLYLSSNKCSVNSAEYGSVWRTLRRNLVSEMLSLSRIKDFSWIREWAIDRLIQRLEAEAGDNNGTVHVLANVRFSVFSILLCMCFAKQLEEDAIIHVDDIMKDILLIVEPQIHDFLPILRPLFAKQWKRIKELRQIQRDNILPLIEARHAVLKQRATANGGANGGEDGDGRDGAHAYIDSLMKLELPEGRGKPSDEELVTLCSELLSAGTDTTSTALEWAMLRMVLHPDIQETLYREIVSG